MSLGFTTTNPIRDIMVQSLASSHQTSHKNASEILGLASARGLKLAKTEPPPSANYLSYLI